MADLLRPLGNDLTAAAGALAPGTGEVLKAIETSPGCPLARMSGSGATCFGLYAEEANATAAGGALGAALARIFHEGAPSERVKCFTSIT